MPPSRSTLLAATLASALSLALAACVSAPLERPIPTARYPAATQQPAQALVILLPGGGDRLGVYQERGFVQALRATGMSVDLLEVDAHYGYYKTRTLLERMQEDVLTPNRARYDEIWIVGISMGGIGALLTAWTYPEQIDGVVLIAPYLGRRRTLRTIDAAGGLREWQPPAETGEWDLEIWRMLHRIAAEGTAAKPELWLLYGVDDFGARAHRMLAEALPSQRVETTAGGHAWTTWTTLWATLMAARPFAREPSAAASEATPAHR